MVVESTLLEGECVPLDHPYVGPATSELYCAAWGSEIGGDAGECATEGVRTHAIHACTFSQNTQDASESLPCKRLAWCEAAHRDEYGVDVVCGAPYAQPGFEPLLCCLAKENVTVLVALDAGDEVSLVQVQAREAGSADLTGTKPRVDEEEYQGEVSFSLDGARIADVEQRTNLVGVESALDASFYALCCESGPDVVRDEALLVAPGEKGAGDGCGLLDRGRAPAITDASSPFSNVVPLYAF